ncbi:DUF3088 family protein [Hyphococcus flavus]|uniref:DUF3088 family protein n=1 Tax=Hyphococcus flavus TaxID=1866326 RepID=A0AAE9ZDG4_9PROT|nr:DUF3088 family protein [Hyphococcus flavus]WDI32734.1 DUF3088 family protein [Hyphococcus flavus]
MERDILFLLPPGFEDNKRREFCPECAEIWGVLSYFPAIKEALDIRYQPIEKPRGDIVAMLGDENQNCPTLVLAKGVDAGPHAMIGEVNGYRFLDNARDIAKYFAHRYGTPFPRGS